MSFEQDTAVAPGPDEIKEQAPRTHSLTLTHTHTRGCKMQMRRVSRLLPPEELPLSPKHLYEHHNTQATVGGGGVEGGERIEEARAVKLLRKPVFLSLSVSLTEQRAIST